MFSIPLNETGTLSLAYTDSGPPADAEYTTFVVIHGGNWYNGVFARLAAVSAEYDIRLICINRRDFPGSTAYHAEELNTIRDEPPNREAFEVFMIERAKEIAQFIRQIIERERLPRRLPRPEGSGQPIVKRGGVVLMGWSLGNAFGFSLLAHPQVLAPETRQVLEDYLHTYVAFDPPFIILSMSEPDAAKETSHVRALLGAGASESLYAFSEWLSSYFRHDFSRPGGEGLEYIQPDPTMKSTVSGMSPEELRACCSIDSPPRSEIYIRRGGQLGVFGEDAWKVIFHEEGTMKVAVNWIWCAMSSWSTVSAALRVMEQLEGQNGTETKTVRLEEANHFVHWEQPRMLMEALRGI